MKKLAIISVLAATVIASVSCKKSHQENHPVSNVFKPDYFVFGRHISMYPIGVYAYSYYMVHDSVLYREDTPGNYFMQNIPMADSQYKVVEPLISQFPAYLLSHHNDTLGCSNCLNQDAMMHIMAITGTDTMYWVLNTDTASLPTDIRSYTQQTLHAWDSLRSNIIFPQQL